jgi:hypothetical protein
VQFKTLILFPSRVLWNCWVRGIAPPGAAGLFDQRGTSLLDYERGVPVAQPHGGREVRKRKEKELHVTATTPRRFHHVTATTPPTSRQPRRDLTPSRPRPRRDLAPVATLPRRYAHFRATTSCAKAAMTDTFVSVNVTRPNIILFSSQIFLLVLWNCRVRGIAPHGAAGLSAQRGHVPFGLKEGRARCTTLRRFRIKKRRGKQETASASAASLQEVQLRARDDTFPYYMYFSPPPSQVLWNCWVRGIAPPGAAGLIAQRGHVPLGL